MSEAADDLVRRAYEARRQDRLSEARRLFIDAAAAYQAAGETLRAAHAIRHAGDTYFDEGRLDQAEPCYAEALDLYRCHGNPPLLDLANAVRSMALLEEATGAIAEAVALWKEAGDLYRSVNVVEGVAESASRVAQLTASDRRPHVARSDPAITDPVFRDAVSALDAGDVETLRQLIDAHPRLLSNRADYGQGYFSQPYLLWFIAENPIRNGRLPPNIVDVARTIVSLARRERVDTLPAQLDYTLALVSSGRIPRESGVQLALIDMLIDCGARPDAALVSALAHREEQAAERLLARGATLTLLAAACLRDEDAVRRLARSATPADRQIALAGAALHGRAGAIGALADSGADVNRYCPDGFHPHATPLHHAVDSGSLEAVKALTEAGARLDARDRTHDGTPLDWAEYLGRAEIAVFLRTADRKERR
jgi:peptide-methionine (S)-S-oxide reductase